MDRLAMLQKMASAKPDDPFPQYGLAMELDKQGRGEDARAAFEALVDRHPDYVASYLMYGNLLRKLGDDAAAVGIYDRGIEVASQAGNEHAASELQAAKAELP